MLKDWMAYLMEIFGFTWEDTNMNGVWDDTEH